MATLSTVRARAGWGQAYPLGKDCVTTGRQYDSTICLNGRAVSRHHAQLVLREGGYFLEDLEAATARISTANG